MYLLHQDIQSCLVVIKRGLEDKQLKMRVDIILSTHTDIINRQMADMHRNSPQLAAVIVFCLPA